MAKPAVSLRPALAKLTPPKANRAVMRERLFAKLDAAVTAAWIYGPPGSGKTTLVASYLRSAELKSLWYQVDTDDREPSTFFHFLTTAAGRLLLRKTVLPVPGAEARADWTAFARRFARVLEAGLPPDTVLVFDNVHEGGESLNRMLAAMIVEMIEPRRTFLVSQHAPPTPFNAAVVRQQLSVVSPDALRFNQAEASQFASEMGLSKKKDDVERMVGMTNGLAAGIALFGSQAKAASRVEMEGASPRQVVDCISRNVIEWMPERTRSLAERCAFFPDFDSYLACLASGDTDGKELMAELKRAKFFVEERGRGVDKSYSFHNLLLEALRSRIGPAGSEARKKAEHDAGLLLIQAGRHEAGISALLAGEAYEAAALHIHDFANLMIDTGREEQLANWIDSLPPLLVEARPWLGYWHAVATISFDFQKAQLVFENVCNQFRDTGDRLGLVMAAAAVLIEFELNWQHRGKASRWANILSEAWDSQLKFTDADSELKALIGLLTTFDLEPRMPRDELDTYLARLPALISSAQGANLKLLASAQLLYFMTYFRDFERGLVLLNLIAADVDFAQAHPRHHLHWLWNADRFLILASRGMFRPDLKVEAAKIREKAMAIADSVGAVDMQIALGHAEATVASNDRDASATEIALDRVEPLLLPSMLKNRAWQYSLRCLLYLLKSQPAEALDWIRKALKVNKLRDSDEDLACSFRIYEATCLTYLGRYDEADRQLAIGIKRTTHEYSYAHRLASLFNRAIEASFLRSGNNEAIRAFLVEMTDQKCFDYGLSVEPLVSGLCEVALIRDIEVDRVREVITRRKLPPPPLAPAGWPWPVRIEALGGFKVYLWDKPLIFDGKAQKKPLEMLKFLIARSDPLNPGRGTRIEDVINELWPNTEAKDPKGSFDVNVHRLRKLLEVDEAIMIVEGRLKLNPGMVLCDAFEFESVAMKALQGEKAEVGSSLTLYGGPLFGKEEEVPWAFATGERIAMRFALLVQRQGEILEEARAYPQAIDMYERGLSQDNLIEPFYRGLMRCYIARNEPAEAMRTYRRCRELLSNVLGLKPAPETEVLRQRITAPKP